MLKFSKKDKLSRAVKILAVGIAILVILWLNYKEILDSGVVASMITAIVTMVVVFITTRSNNIQSEINSKTILEQCRRQGINENVIKVRIKWIEMLEEYAAEYIGILEEISMLKDPDGFRKSYKTICITANKLNFHLDPFKKENREILDQIQSITNLISNIDYYKNYDSTIDIIVQRISLLIRYIQIYLKTERKRVESESNKGEIGGFKFNETYTKYINESKDEIKKIEDEIKKIEDKIKKIERN